MRANEWIYFRYITLQSFKIAWELCIKQILVKRVWTGSDVLDPVGHVWTGHLIIYVIVHDVFLCLLYILSHYAPGMPRYSIVTVCLLMSFIGTPQL